MHPLRTLSGVALAFLSSACSAPPTATSARGPAPSIAWESWSPAAFDRARSEHRLVLLDLGAVWCHWCHVMEETTYADPDVTELVARGFVAVKVDQDSRPDLANRYEDYGWPATIVFDARGNELVKRAGYIPPGPMASMLRALIADPTPGPSVVTRSTIEYSRSKALAPELRGELEASLARSYDAVHGGFGSSHKYLDAPSVEYLIARAIDGDEASARMARETLDANLVLVDPGFGGVYQYSTGGVWTEPHYEKIMSFQADDLRLYSLAYAVWKDERYAGAARSIQRFLATTLASPDGAFYTSQDADLVQGEHAAEYFALGESERRARGVPRVDTHVYARENGWAVRALAAWYGASGDEDALARARRATEWIVRERAIEGGGFRHDARDAAGPYLGDTLAMAEAFLALHETTAERTWLARAEDASAFMAATFARDPGGAGYATAAGGELALGALASAGPQREENLAVARLENALHRYTGRAEHEGRAERAMRYLATPAIARTGFTSRALLADRELASEPLHVTVVGPKDDERARALFRAALAIPATYRRIEWWDPREGPLASTDVEYPELDRPAAFVCTGGRCSSPAFEPAELAQRVEKSRKSAGP